VCMGDVQFESLVLYLVIRPALY